MEGRPRKYISGHNFTDNKPFPTCKCGCGHRTIYHNEPYLPYHWTKKLNNPELLCACGCGEKLKKYDKNGRVRKFMSGHKERQERLG